MKITLKALSEIFGAAIENGDYDYAEFDSDTLEVTYPDREGII